MAQVFREALQLQQAKSLLHSYRAICLKFALIALSLAARFIDLYAMLIALSLNLFLMVYVGARRVLLAALALWLLLSSTVIAIDVAFSTLTTDVIQNLVYGFTTFTAIALFYMTTPPVQVRRLLGFNVLSLSYLLLGYALKLVTDLLDGLRARGWDYGLNPYGYRYPLRAFAVMLMVRTSEYLDALRARGVDA